LFIYLLEVDVETGDKNIFLKVSYEAEGSLIIT
jgi:hypothetical protein